MFDYGYYATGKVDVRGNSEDYISVTIETKKELVARKNNFELYKIIMCGTITTEKYEIYYEGEFWNNYNDKKKAEKMFKDFAA